MDRRSELHAKLCDLLGSRHVYFQPPETVKLIFPCIIYNLDNIHIRHADDKGYLGKKRYAVTIISKDPDFSIVDELAMWPLCTFSRFFTVDNLNHWTFDLYY